MKGEMRIFNYCSVLGFVVMSLYATDADLIVQEAITEDQNKTLSWLSDIPAHPERSVVDRIVARVNGVNILQSDLDLPRISTENGRPFTLEEAIMEELMIQHASGQHILPSALDIERQITGFKIQNGLQDMTDEEFEKQLKDGGLTLKSYKQQIGRRIAVENVKRAEIYEKIVTSSQEVEAYYKKHPIYTKEAYRLQMSILGEDELAADQKGEKATWEKLDWINKDDLSEDLQCVLHMKKGEISAPLFDSEKGEGAKIKLVKIVDKREKRLKTLNERYAEIDQLLQHNKRVELSQAMENELKAKAMITYL